MTAAGGPLQPFRCVVDASVAIKLFVAEDLSDNAARLFGVLTTGSAAELLVPDLFYIECANILWKHVRRFGFPVSDARAAIQELGALALASVPTSELTVRALEIAVAAGITAYDASYVALAERANTSLVTADERLANTLAGTQHRVDWLGNLMLPAD